MRRLLTLESAIGPSVSLEDQRGLEHVPVQEPAVLLEHMAQGRACCERAIVKLLLLEGHVDNSLRTGPVGTGQRPHLDGDLVVDRGVAPNPSPALRWSVDLGPSQDTLCPAVVLEALKLPRQRLDGHRSRVLGRRQGQLFTPAALRLLIRERQGLLFVTPLELWLIVSFTSIKPLARSQG